MKALKAKNLYGIRRIQSGLLILFTLLILLLFNGSAWWIYLRVGRYLDEIYSRSLQESAELAALALHSIPEITKPAPSENSIPYLERQIQLIRLQESGNFNDLFLIDTEYRNLVGVYPDFTIGKFDGLLTLDQEYLEQARLGQTVLTPVVESEGLFLRTVYVPVFGPGQTVEAILAAKADVEFLKPKIAIRNTLTIITILNVAVILMLALVYARSIKALQRTEAQIVHSERLASLGQMAAGIAHELRNPLTIMEQTITLLRRRYEKNPDELFGYIPGEISRMNGIITQFLDLSKEAPVEMAEGDLITVLNRTLALLEYQLKKNQVQVHRDYPESIPLTLDPHKMQQVFLNLCLNAIEAMPEKGGSLTLKVILNPYKQELCAVVEDNGIGMTPQQINRIFDPFFTQKATGTGLGLWVVEQIISRHGGRIEVDSKPDHGTRMKIFLRRG